MDTSHHTTEINELGHSPDAQQERQQQLLNLLRQTAPEVISDNQLNLERLKELMGEERLAPAEHYELSWAGKKDARREIQKKTSHTLRPDANNPESAQHMLIEGENLEVLRVLQKSYYGKVKMIYIDPPYNTGNDSFVYPDDYSETLEEYQKRTGEKNEAGFLNKQSLWKKNSKEGGQYHSAWLSMMYPRLYLARNLLREDGVIFISIDDNEAANLKLLCDEVFGEDNFSGFFLRQKKKKPSFLHSNFGSMYEYIACYAKNFKLSPPFSVDVTTAGKKYPLNNSGNSLSTLLFPSGSVTFSKKNETYYPCDMSEGNILTELLDKVQVVEYKNVNEFRLKGEFRYSQSRLNEIIESNDVLTITKSPFRPNHVRSGGEIKKMHNHLSPSTYNVGTNEDASSELEEILGGDFFDNPKPFSLVSTLCKAVTHDDLNSVVFDFFSGSGTTAHAVMELNAEDGGNRQSISVQLPEKLEENSEAYKAGYRTIADITRARIEKVIAKLKAEHPEKTEGLACAHFTLAPSNFKVWNSELNDPGAIRQQLDALQNTEKHADEQTAMLTELLLKNGLGALGVHAVSKPRTLACGVTVHRVLREDDRYLWLCFEPYVDALRDEILNANPAQVIMLNSCFTGTQGDEQLSNLQLELAAQDINLLVI
ncbi:site-specific DNA-methyltransferase [Halomonas aquamarina]|uniref:site-specific DNA-methyltransferase n=1 Tax=Vreelandella aquamarina TaxID=77097 RepID=UPI002359716E|nr:site-specific DNA-methyltransferase [Halomonas aquamarina]MDC8443139.1 site-specific DNA-methyltransferase [Halomonas aquamarina]